MMTAIFAEKNIAYYLYTEYYETLYNEENQQSQFAMHSCEIWKSEKLWNC